MSADAVFPVVDASRETCLSDEAADFFRTNGLLVLRNVVPPHELTSLRAETSVLVDTALAGDPGDGDHFYKTHEATGEVVPYRVEYVVDKSSSARALLAHPFLLKAVEKLQGPEFIPTWDSMVFKTEGMGASIPWHRDGGLYPDSVGLLASGRVFNVDVYLDRADLGSCLWGLLGSNNWPDEQATEVACRLNEGGVTTEGATPLPMEPGDVILHNVLVLHGSQATRGPLRRVLYFEFRPIDIELEHGPHTSAYVAAKQHVLAAAIRHREQVFGASEYPYDYRPSSDAPEPSWATDPPTWRFPHADYWREGALS